MKSWKVDDGVAEHFVAPQKLDSEPAMEKAERQHHLYCGVPKSQRRQADPELGVKAKGNQEERLHISLKAPPRTPPTQPSAQQTTAPPSA